MIPPSIILIVYGVATEQSIARLFVAGVLPGLLLVALFVGYVAIWSLLNRDKLPDEAFEFSFREKLPQVTPPDPGHPSDRRRDWVHLCRYRIAD